MATKIEEGMGVQVDFVPEGNGVFDVSVDGNLEYSKFQTGSFPQEEHLVIDLVAKYNPE